MTQQNTERKVNNLLKFNEWFKEYHSAFCEGVLAYDCQRDYFYINQKHFYPIADMELSDIRPIDVQKCIKTTIEYSSERQRKAFFLLKRVLEQAVINELIEKNPAQYIKAPKKQRKIPKCFDSEDVKHLFECDTKLSRMFEFDLWTGLRRGELLALTWENIDLKKRILYVRQTLVREKGCDTIKNTTKSRTERIVTLPPKAIEILLRIREKDSSEGLVFSNNGNPISLRNYNKLYVKFFNERKKEYPDLPYLSPHKLRHTYATYMLHSGADVETLKSLLGHVDISTTQRYVHSNARDMLRAAESLTFA